MGRKIAYAVVLATALIPALCGRAYGGDPKPKKLSAYYHPIDLLGHKEALFAPVSRAPQESCGTAGPLVRLGSLLLHCLELRNALVSIKGHLNPPPASRGFS